MGGRTYCINNNAGDETGCQNRPHKNTAFLTCTECSLSKSGVDESKVDGKHTEYIDRIDGLRKKLEYTLNRHPILTWPMVSEHVPADKHDKVQAQWEKNKQGNRDSKKAMRARKAGKVDAPASKRTERPADAPERQHGQTECVVPGCYNMSSRGVGGISCTNCAVDAFGTSFDSETGWVRSIFDPEQNEEVAVSYLNNQNPTVPFSCLAIDYVEKENYESRKAFWEKKREAVTAAVRVIDQRKREERIANTVWVQPKASPAELTKIAKETKTFVDSVSSSSLWMASKGMFIAEDQGQKNNEHIAHTIRPHRGPLLIRPDGRALSAIDIASGRFVAIRMKHTGTGREQLAFDAEEHAQLVNRWDRRRLWQKNAAGEHTSRGRGGEFSCCVLEYVDALDQIRDGKLALRSDMNQSTKARLIKDHPWLGESKYAYCWVEPAFDAHIRTRDYQRARNRRRSLEKKMAVTAAAAATDGDEVLEKKRAAAAAADDDEVLDKKPKAKTENVQPNKRGPELQRSAIAQPHDQNSKSTSWLSVRPSSL
mmetsp:Transcript_11374/g.26764  ORF Transcript_11374/g.26764 Transcript_11374/m.26764 type:complete len:539 (+) Transcript_11374:1602-3218(+)